ncbi:MAG: uroporphyrinogen-III C-methyltransferase [Desulfatiglans sp.]|jgi:uroporphyrinogen III methyltransferase/synthase|nr:uroporphyrinogen-III C-methyltransferase [Desulfatiglans sp.]
MTTNKRGKVYLVGAGPGDPGLMTLKGKECLHSADVVVYDYLANSAFLDYAGDGAELIYVGKKGGCHTKTQEEISALITNKALEGKMVVRLKGGDPFVFGRGGEESQELARAGVDFEVVPGVTSAIAVPAYAGIPLTHRDHASSVAFITGHEDPTKETSSIAWDKLATGVDTLVFLMGVKTLPMIAENLLASGRSPDTPVAVIENGTTPGQRTTEARLKDIARVFEKADIKPPAIIVLGDVVSLRDKLNWFESMPLFGKKIVVTRATEQASGFLKSLSRLGASCIEFPTIEVVPPDDDWRALDRAIGIIETYEWLLFTSANGVRYFLERLYMCGRDVRDLQGRRIGAIGPKTAQAWSDLGIRPDLVPSEYRAEAVVAALEQYGVKGTKVLLPRATVARDILPEELRKMGASVDVIPAYRTRKPDHDTERVRGMFARGEIDMVTFTSSSTVTNFVDMFGPDPKDLAKSMAEVTVACIGPITAKTAEEKGFHVSLMPSEYTIEALTEGIREYFAPETSLE